MTIFTDLSPELQSKRAVKPSQWPANFSLAHVMSVRPLGSQFLRVRLEGDDLTRFGSDALHFRLVLPQTAPEEIVWPSVDREGQTVWPKGDRALHRPAYTIRKINRDAGWLEFDVYVHDGGRVTEWARKATRGHVVGIVGPIGRPCPIAPDILLAGDETAFPAIARILEAPQRPAMGDVFLYSDACDYDFNVPENYRLHWMSPKDGAEPFIERLKATPRTDESFIWFAGEKFMTQALRKHFLEECGVPKNTSYISAYWRR